MKIFWLTLVAVTAAVIAGILALQLPQVQTYIADRIVSSIDDRLDADIEFEKIHIKPFTTLILKKVAIIDRNPASDVLDPSKEKVDTFFRADYIIAKFTLSGLADHEGIHLRKAYINGAQMNLVLEEKADEYLVVKRGILEPDEAIIESIYLELPSRLLCSPDCRGLCPKCGKKMIGDECGCAPREIDPRWSKLKALLDEDDE